MLASATPGVQGERTIKTRVYSSNGQVVDRQNYLMRNFGARSTDRQSRNC